MEWPVRIFEAVVKERWFSTMSEQWVEAWDYCEKKMWLFQVLPKSLVLDHQNDFSFGKNTERKRKKKSRRWEGHQYETGGDAGGLAQGWRSRILLSLGVFMTNATIFIRDWSRGLRVKFKFSDDHPLDFFLWKISGAKNHLLVTIIKM